MRHDALFKRFEFLVAAAVIAAHANSRAQGFRQREVRFLIELFSNWVSASLEGEVLELKNTQILRYLEGLSSEAFARRSVRQRFPVYRLTRLGLIELLSRLVNPPAAIPPAQFFFVFYFVTNYRPRISELIREEGKQFPPALRIEVDSLLDSDALVARQLEILNRELQKLEEKSNDSVRGSRLAIKLYAQGQPHLEVARQIEKIFPYSLNSQKPLSELLGEVPPDIGRWELEVGGLKRSEQIFSPTKLVLTSYIQALKRLAGK